VAGHVLLGGRDEEEVVEVADVADAELRQGEVDHRQQLRADTRRCAESERHVGELVQLALEAEAEVPPHRGVQWEGQEAVGQVELAVPASWLRGLHCIVYRAVREVLVLQVVVEVAGQIDDEPWLFARLDDDVQRLNAETVVGEVGVRGQLDDGAELHVLAQASTDVRHVLHNGGRVGVGDGGWGAD
jgi:hypothetical protein